MNRLAAVILAAALVSAGAPAIAAAKPKSGSAALAEAKRMMRVPKYTAAIEALARALDDPELARRERIEALELLAAAHMARNDPPQAEAAFSALLELAPDHQLAAGVSPKIRDVFDSARKNRQRPPRIEAVTATLAATPLGTPSSTMIDESLSFTAKLDDPDRAASRVAVYTRAGDEAFTETRMSAENGTYTATVAVGPGTTRIEYYVAVFDYAKRISARAGSAESPSAILLSRERRRPEPEPIAALPPPEPPPPRERMTAIVEPQDEDQDDSVISRWWFWAIIGVVAAGAGTGAYLIATRSDQPEAAGNLPLIQLP